MEQLNAFNVLEHENSMVGRAVGFWTWSGRVCAVLAKHTCGQNLARPGTSKRKTMIRLSARPGAGGDIVDYAIDHLLRNLSRRVVYRAVPGF